MNILEKIVADKRVEIAARKIRQPSSGLKPADSFPNGNNFIRALRSVPVGLIAEVKRRSPSAGAIREPFNPSEIACTYEKAGAQALSVLVDEKYFGGGEEPFRAVRSSVRLPLLYKEFVVDPWQIAHARSLGAAAILLIAAVLKKDELRQFMYLADEAGLATLVEVHDEAEMRVAAELECPLIGINNRNLKDFHTTLDTTFQLRELAPPDCTLVSESGIKTFADIERLRAAGIHAVLVGESLLQQPDLHAAVVNLMHGQARS
jgi:indole-3-glycerol phosphate synthase